MKLSDLIISIVLGWLLISYVENQVLSYAEKTIKSELQAQLPSVCKVKDLDVEKDGFMTLNIDSNIDCRGEIIHLTGQIVCHLTTQEPYVDCTANVSTDKNLPIYPI